MHFFIHHPICKEHETLCKPSQKILASLSSLGSGGSGLFRSGHGRRGNGFDIKGAGQETGTGSLGVFDRMGASVSSDMVCGAGVEILVRLRCVRGGFETLGQNEMRARKR